MGLLGSRRRASRRATAPRSSRTLETVLKRNPSHPGAIHLYIHAVEASTQPEKALPYAKRLAALMPGAGHVVHMPAHIYYRVGMYRDSLDANQRAMPGRRALLQDLAVGPAVQGRVLPAQHPLRDGVGADGRRRARPRSTPPTSSTPRCRSRWSRQFAILQPVKAAPYTTHAQFSDRRHDPEAAGAARRPGARRDDVPLRARGRLRRARRTPPPRRREIDALARIERDADFKPFEDWGVPAKEIVQTARLVATGRLADASGDLDGAAKAYEERDRHRGRASPTPSRRTGTTRCASRSARCGCARASSTMPRRRSASRWRACATTAGRSPDWSRSRKRRGDAKAEQTARASFERAWFGVKEGPDLGRL